MIRDENSIARHFCIVSLLCPLLLGSCLPLSVDAAQASKLLHFGWSTSGNQAVWSSFIEEGEQGAVEWFFSEAADFLEDMLQEGAAALADRIEIHGPTSPGDGKALTIYTEEGYFRRNSAQGGSTETTCTIHPVFKVGNWASVLPAVSSLLTQAQEEHGCRFYGFHRDSGNTLVLNAAFDDGASVLEHFLRAKDFGALNNGSLKQGACAELVSLEVHGPKTELDTIRDAEPPRLKPEYFEGYVSSAAPAWH